MIPPQIQVLDHGYVKLIETWGSEERIIEAARMSTGKVFQGWGPVHSEGCLARRLLSIGYEIEPCTCEPKLGDEKLLRYLYEHKHMTPFEMAGMTIEVQAPIFVFREWHRHRTQSYNEMSGRYVELPKLCYVPSVERIAGSKQATVNKQGSQQFENVALVQASVRTAFAETYNIAWAHYEELLELGVARELASRVLPVSQYSRMRASTDLRNWLGFLKLRMAPDAQWEIRQFANVVGTLIAEAFPRTWALFSAGPPS